MTTPLYPVNISDKERERIERSLLEGDGSDPDLKPKGTSKIVSPESYLIVPGKDRPDLLVSVDRYHHNSTWRQSNELLKNEGFFMLAPRYFVEFLSHLRSGKPVYDGRGAKIDHSKVDSVIDEILTVRDPLRAEWLDARFGKKRKGLLSRSENTITYHRIKTDGTLEESTEPLDCLMKDKTPGIDLDSWLRTPTEQGLPRKNIGNGKLYYWYPKDGAVAWFGADSDRADLDCDGSPQVSGAALGVRRAKIF